jgi:nicotinate-nucleotide adenylyltransferase
VLKTGIFGGTFNPVHVGHVINAQFITEEFSLDRIIFIPSKKPVHKEIDNDILLDERCAMLQCALEGIPWFEVSRIEVDRTSASYTITTIDHFRQLHPDDELFLIIGADSYNDLNTWKDYRKILETTSIIVMNRPGNQLDRERFKIFNSKILFSHNPFLDISSSMIRSRIKSNKTIRFLVPQNVENYITQRELYKN